MIEIREIKSDDELNEVLRVRKEIFVDEQGIPEELDNDSLDLMSNHLVATEESGNIIATGRITCMETVGFISRVAVRKDFRGQEIGRRIVVALEKIATNHGIRRIKLSPHAFLEGFYHNLGYTKVDGDIQKAGPHKLILMEKDLP